MKDKVAVKISLIIALALVVVTSLIVSLVAIHLNWFDPSHEGSSDSSVESSLPAPDTTYLPDPNLSPSDSSLPTILTLQYDNEADFQSFRIVQDKKIMLGPSKGFFCDDRVLVSSVSAYFASGPEKVFGHMGLLFEAPSNFTVVIQQDNKKHYRYMMHHIMMGKFWFLFGESQSDLEAMKSHVAFDSTETVITTTHMLAFDWTAKTAQSIHAIFKDLVMFRFKQFNPVPLRNPNTLFEILMYLTSNTVVDFDPNGHFSKSYCCFRHCLLILQALGSSDRDPFSAPIPRPLLTDTLKKSAIIVMRNTANLDRTGRSIRNAPEVERALLDRFNELIINDNGGSFWSHRYAVGWSDGDMPTSVIWSGSTGILKREPKLSLLKDQIAAHIIWGSVLWQLSTF